MLGFYEGIFKTEFVLQAVVKFQ